MCPVAGCIPFLSTKGSIEGGILNREETRWDSRNNSLVGYTGGVSCQGPQVRPYQTHQVAKLLSTGLDQRSQLFSDSECPTSSDRENPPLNLIPILEKTNTDIRRY